MSVYLIVCGSCGTCVSTLGTQGGHRAARAQLSEHKALRGHAATLYLAEEVRELESPDVDRTPHQLAGFGWRGPAHR